MLNIADQRLLDTVKQWMTEPGTRTFLANYEANENWPKNYRTLEMNDDLKRELIKAGVEDFGQTVIRHDDLSEQETQQSALTA